jgi:uncharacterized protein (DUF1330 family)
VAGKGYIIARIDVTDPELYRRYTDVTPTAAAAFGGRFLVRGGRCEQLEGEGRARQVVIEFPSYAAAKAFYDSEAYRSVLQFALAGSIRELVVVEGIPEKEV